MAAVIAAIVVLRDVPAAVRAEAQEAEAADLVRWVDSGAARGHPLRGRRPLEGTAHLRRHRHLIQDQPHRPLRIMPRLRRHRLRDHVDAGGSLHPQYRMDTQRPLCIHAGMVESFLDLCC